MSSTFSSGRNAGLAWSVGLTIAASSAAVLTACMSMHGMMPSASLRWRIHLAADCLMSARMPLWAIVQGHYGVTKSRCMRYACAHDLHIYSFGCGASARRFAPRLLPLPVARGLPQQRSTSSSGQPAIRRAGCRVQCARSGLALLGLRKLESLSRAARLAHQVMPWTRNRLYMSDRFSSLPAETSRSADFLAPGIEWDRGRHIVTRLFGGRSGGN